MSGKRQGSPIDLTEEVVNGSKRKHAPESPGADDGTKPEPNPSGSSPHGAKRAKTGEPSEEKRLRVFRQQAPKAFRDIWHRALYQRFFVLKRTRCEGLDGLEEEFELAGTTGNVYTVRIARQPKCSCPMGKARQQCKHVIYVLHRVLRARYELVYQLALLRSELDEIFERAPRIESRAEAEKRNRKEVAGEDCPVCYVPFEPGTARPESLVWCRAACGQNFHKLCFDMWAKTCGKDRATCPLCRSLWEGDDEELVASVSQGSGVMREGYVNVASQLGLSGIRDTSTYSRWSRFGDLGQGGFFRR